MLEVWHMWVITGLLLWIIEIFTPGFVTGVFGTACLIAAPFAGTGASFKMQLVVFGTATAVLSLGIRPLILRNFCSREPKIKTNIDALVGKTGVVTEAIDNDSRMGRVRIGSEEWRAISLDEMQVGVGQKVTVHEVDGCKVVVQQNKGEIKWTIS